MQYACVNLMKLGMELWICIYSIVIQPHMLSHMLLEYWVEQSRYRVECWVNYGEEYWQLS